MATKLNPPIFPCRAPPDLVPPCPGPTAGQPLPPSCHTVPDTPLLHAMVPDLPLHLVKLHAVHFSAAIAARRELITYSPLHRPFPPAAAQNESAPTPFNLSCTPSPPRCYKPYGLLLFPTTVNSATMGVHHRSAGSGDPLVPLSLPRGVPVRCKPHGPFLLHKR
jgi:hypothetical protein